MAAVTPLPEKECVGTFIDGTPDYQLKCLKTIDQQGQPVFTCVTSRVFKANCPKLNQTCSKLSSAFLAAITVCNQHLY